MAKTKRTNHGKDATGSGRNIRVVGNCVDNRTIKSTSTHWTRSKTAAAVASFSFFAFPAEIRVLVYHLILNDCAAVSYIQHPPKQRRRLHPGPPGLVWPHGSYIGPGNRMRVAIVLPPLLFTCRAAYLELAPLFYASAGTTFVFECGEEVAALASGLSTDHGDNSIAPLPETRSVPSPARWMASIELSVPTPVTQNSARQWIRAVQDMAEVGAVVMTAKELQIVFTHVPGVVRRGRHISPRWQVSPELRLDDYGGNADEDHKTSKVHKAEPRPLMVQLGANEALATGVARIALRLQQLKTLQVSKVMLRGSWPAVLDNLLTDQGQQGAGLGLELEQDSVALQPKPAMAWPMGPLFRAVYSKGGNDANASDEQEAQTVGGRASLIESLQALQREQDQGFGA